MRLVIVAMGALLCFGCGDGSDDTDSGVDPIDSGNAVDAGGAIDSGPPDTDAGPDSGPLVDAGPPVLSCEMGTIRIEQACPAFTACGGELVGTWCYADVCITKDELLARVLEQPGVPAECTADEIQLLSSEGMIDGTIEITETDITRTLTTEVTGKFNLPEDCVIGTCNATEFAINEALDGMGSADCIMDEEGTGCICDILFTSTVDMTDTYIASANVITTGRGRTFDYCVEDGNLRFSETTDGGEPGVQTALPVEAP